MSAVRAFVTFLVTLLFTSFVIAIVSEGALKGEDATMLRTIVLGAAVLFSAVVAWASWRFGSSRPAESVPSDAAKPSQPVPASSASRDASKPDSAAVEAAVAAARRSGIALVREYPPRFAATPRSFLGGTPVAPRELAWPAHKRKDGRTVPMTFMAQVDCTELPESDARALLPRDGALLFFLDFNETAPRVLHVPGSPASWVLHRWPSNAPPVFGDHAKHVLPWIAHTPDAEQNFPRSFPKWPVRLIALDTYNWEHPFDRDTSEEKEFDRRLGEAVKDAITRAFGEPVEWRELTPGVSSKGPAAWRPFDGFPHSWLAIEWAGGAVLEELVALSGWGTRELSPEWAKVQNEARSWVVRAREHDPMSKPGATDTAQFWRWLDGVASLAPMEDDTRMRGPSVAVVNKALKTAASLAVEASLVESTRAASGIPADVVEALRSRHHPRRRSGDMVDLQLEHQMLGQPKIIQDPGYSDDHLLLLQLVWDPAMMWMFGDVGAYQYWILEEDLRAGRFDRVKLTFEMH